MRFSIFFPLKCNVLHEMGHRLLLLLVSTTSATNESGGNFVCQKSFRFPIDSGMLNACKRLLNCLEMGDMTFCAADTSKNNDKSVVGSRHLSQCSLAEKLWFTFLNCCLPDEQTLTWPKTTMPKNATRNVSKQTELCYCSSLKEMLTSLNVFG